MFGKSPVTESAARLLDEEIYESVVIELSEGNRRSGLWAKAIADSEGVEDKAKSLYIKYRVQSIKDERTLAEESETIHRRAKQQQAEQKQVIQRNNSIKRFILKLVLSLIGAFLLLITLTSLYILVLELTGRETEIGLTASVGSLIVYGGALYVCAKYLMRVWKVPNT